jgi:hypothetical protein
MIRREVKMRFSRSRLLASLLASTMMVCQPVLAAGGTALGVKPQADLLSAGETVVLVVGKDIQIGDEVSTGEYGQVQIKFDDATELVVGPNSKLLIEDYLLRADSSAGKFAINALAGTFRFATGTAAKDRYQITTPTGTIGVRGTEFDFVVDEDGTRVLLFDGAVKICSASGQCTEISDPCSLGVYDEDESSDTGATTSMTRKQRDALRTAFKYAQDQSPLMQEFWFVNARQCLNPPPDLTGIPRSILPPGETPVVDRPPPPPECDDYYCECEGYRCPG